MQDIELSAYEAWDKGNLRTALDLFKSSSMAGSKTSALCIGLFYDDGIGIPKSKSTALHWYKLAYRSTDSSAATNIAIFHKERNQLKLMFRWLRIATRLDDGDAELDLAKCYLSGSGTVRSNKAALLHLRKALKSKRITQAGIEEACAFNWRSSLRIRKRLHQ
jgi:TPR repeat protein